MQSPPFIQLDMMIGAVEKCNTIDYCKSPDECIKRSEAAHKECTSVMQLTKRLTGLIDDLNQYVKTCNLGCK